MTDKVDIWITVGSALVSFVSAIGSVVSAGIAWKSGQQARQAATLTPRTVAIGHLRNALDDIIKRGSVGRDTVDSIQKAMHISQTVFKQFESDLEQAWKTADRLDVPLERSTASVDRDTLALRNELQNLIDRMNQAAGL